MKQTIYHSLAEYIDACNRWRNTPAVITPSGKLLMIVNGREVSKKEFEAANPKPTYEPPSTGNLHVEITGTLYGVRNRKK